MPWQAWLLVSVGAILAGVFGFLIGRWTAPTGSTARAVEKEDAADAKADRDRQQIDTNLAETIEQTNKANAKELADALNKDFSDT